MTAKIFERPFVVIRDTAELYGWTVKYCDYGIGHDAHVLTRGESTVTVRYHSGRAVSAAYAGPQSITVPSGTVPPVTDWVIEQLEADGAPPDTAAVAWREWTGNHWMDRITDPMPYPEAVDAAQTVRTQRVVTVTDVRVTTSQQTPATT